MSAFTRRRRSRGQALAEFALVFPIFVLMLFGLFDLGRAVFVYNSLTNAAREGARLAIVNQDAASGGAIQTRALEQTFGSGANVCIAFVKAGATWTAACPPTGSATPPAAADQCPTTNVVGQQTGYTIGCVASVKVTAAYAPLTPIVGNIVGSFDLSAQTELPIEFTCPNPQIPDWSTTASCPKQP